MQNSIRFRRTKKQRASKMPAVFICIISFRFIEWKIRFWTKSHDPKIYIGSAFFIPSLCKNNQLSTGNHKGVGIRIPFVLQDKGIPFV
ncbi:MAG: hypothetical protein BGN88_08090 [Clostridiales bacterium 43-6]|nr:MAG: hypothetical protein BGN88_08090 [Clostridiales bacterium 43-6]